MRSHVDPCTFIPHIQIAIEHIDDTLRDALSNYKLEQGKSPHDLLEMLPNRSKQIEFHERYHYWQGLRLPFVYRYALLAFHAAINGFREAAPLILENQQISAFAPGLERLSISSDLGRSNDGVIFFGNIVEAPDSNLLEVTQISCLGLLECAASLAEYQISTEAAITDPTEFKRWTKKNPASIRPFLFAAKFLESEELALRIMLPLINSCFHTSQPERAFAELLAVAWRFSKTKNNLTEILSHPEPLRWTEQLESWISNLPFDEVEDANSDLLTTDFFRLTLREWVFGGVGSENKGLLNHPFLAHKARAWIELEETTPFLKIVLDQPGWMTKEIADIVLSAFSPALCIYKFALDEQRHFTFLAGGSNPKNFTTIDLPNPSDWRGFVVDFLTMYSAMRKLGNIHMDDNSRICHHSECCHYEKNLCSSYPIIASKHENCGFPNRLIRLASEWRK